MSTEIIDNHATSPLPITDLDPTNPPPPNRHIRAVITLLWPYSSSTRSCALLLGDPDFRLRLHRGQVRVRLHGPSARVVAERQIGIGDTVELGLSGARWVEEDALTASRTPGKSVEAELDYIENLELRVWSDEGVVKDVKVHEPENGSWKRIEGRIDVMETPDRRRGKGDWMAGFYGAVPIYSSPAFVRRARLSAEGEGSFMDGFDPFEAWEQDEQRPRKRPRFSIEGVRSWRYADGPTSPHAEITENRTVIPSVEKAEEDSRAEETESGIKGSAMAALELVTTTMGMLQQAMADRPSRISEDPSGFASPVGTQERRNDREPRVMQPPPLPLLQMPTNRPAVSSESATHAGSPHDDRPSTPKLQPIASENLPLPSPFPNDIAHLQLGALHNSLGPHIETVGDAANASLMISSSSADVSQQPTRDLEASHHEISSKGAESGAIEAVATAFREQDGTIDGGSLPLQERSPVDEDVATRENSEDGRILKLPYSHELSDTEEDDGEMYTKRFPQNLFDPHQDIDDATEDEEDEKSGSATPTGDNLSHRATQSTTEPPISPSLKLQSNKQIASPQPFGSPVTTTEISHVPSLEPQTPSRDPQAVNLIEIGDGAATVKKPTPQSEKDKIMNETYRSLFGWRTSPIQSSSTKHSFTAPEVVETRPLVNDPITTNAIVADKGSTSRSIQPIFEKVEQAQQVVTDKDSTPKALDVESSENNATQQNIANVVVPQLPTGPEHAQTNEHQIIDLNMLEKYDVLDANAEPDTAMHDVVEAPRQPQTTHIPDYPPIPASLERPATFAGEDEGQHDEEQLNMLQQENLSFPSTTAVATDFMSSTEQVSFEQFFNPTLNTAGSEQLHPSLLESFDSRTARFPASTAHIEPHEDILSTREYQIASQTIEELRPLREPFVKEQANKDHATSHVNVTSTETSQENSKQGDFLTENQELRHVTSTDQRLQKQRHPTEQTAEDTLPSAGVVHENQTIYQEPTSASVEAVSSNGNSRLQPSPVFTEKPPTELDPALQQQPFYPTDSSPVRSHDHIASQQSAAGSEVVKARRKVAPPARILTQGISPVKERGTTSDTRSPQTPKTRASTEKGAPQGTYDDTRLTVSPVNTPLRRSTRATRKSQTDEPPVQLTNITESSQISPSNKAPAKKSTHQAETSGVSEAGLLTPSAKTTPVRKSSRLQAQSEPQDTISVSTVAEPQSLTRKVSQPQAVFKVPPKEIDEDISDNVTIASDLDRGTNNSNKSSLQSEDKSNASLKKTSRKSTLEEPSPSSLRETAELAASPSRRSRKSRTHMEISPAAAQGAIGSATSNRKQKTPARRSVPHKYTPVPEAISQWFSPRRSSRLQDDEISVETPTKDEVTKKTLVKGATRDESSTQAQTVGSQKQPASGISTSLSYYMPLSRIDEKLNIPAQSGSDNSIDILAVVSDETRVPERAKSGPRDYYTVFHITDPSMASKASVLVEVFRPWHANLPIARIGDVVLLRACTVKSRKRQAYLKSSEASSWCVWRFSDGGGGGGERALPEGSPRARRRLSSHVAREEMKGPPVEVGEGERENAQNLRNWWQDGVEN